MGDRLDRYRRMRDFSVTTEPEGVPEPPATASRRFVVQQHDATRLHWDLRLEREGVLASWALPRGLPWNPGENRLAVHTEDHPLEYLDFHGEIPEGQYGAGRMTLWDRGTYDVTTFTDDKVVVALHGRRVQGTYALFPIRGRDWMIHRVDAPQDPARRPIPQDLRPMEAVDGGLPDPTGDWAFEIRWKGVRVLLTNDAGHVTTVDAAGNDVTSLFPEVRRVGRSLGAVESVLDAVIVPLGDGGRPSVDDQAIGRRLAARDHNHAKRLSRDRPVAAMFFDILWIEGHDTFDLRYEDRRTLLVELELQGPAWQTPAHHRGDGSRLLEAARTQGLAGLVAKRLASAYRPGTATGDWIAVAP